MKNYLSFILMFSIILLTSCNKEDEPTNQTFFVNVFTQYGEDRDEDIVGEIDNAHVYLFANSSKTIDKKESFYSIYEDGELIYTDGTKAKYLYKSPSTLGINTFEDIPNGDYILAVSLVTYGRTVGVSHKPIEVNYDYRVTTEKKVFLYGKTNNNTNYGYQDWDEKW